MKKDFLPYYVVRNNALKMADQIHREGFFPDVIYVSLRGGAYIGNIVSEYFKLVNAAENRHPVLYAAVVARSYTDIRKNGKIMIDGWTYAPEHLRHGDKILLLDDIFDTGKTINFLVDVLLEKGIPRDDIKVAVHDYKYFTYKTEQLAIQPDYFCRKFIIEDPKNDFWIHYMSHELAGLSKDELEAHYYSTDPSIRPILDSIL